MKFRWDKKYLYWGITALLVVSAGICLYFLLFRGSNFKASVAQIVSISMPIIDGLVLAYLMTPVLNFIENKIFIPLLKRSERKLSHKIHRAIRMFSVTLTVIFVGLVLYSFFTLVIPQILNSIQSIVFQFPLYVNNLLGWLEEVLADNPEIEEYVANMINTYTPEIRNWMNNILLPQMNEMLKIVSLYAFNLVHALWNLLIGFIISVYIMSSKEKFTGQIKKLIYSLLDVKQANQLIEDIRFVHRTFGGFISGKILDSFLIGILCFVGTSLIGTPYALLVSVIVGITNIIPFFGPYLGAIPSALLILMINPIQCLYFLIFVLLLQQFDGNILGPKILGNSTGLSSFWVIFSITIFGGFMGVLGMVIGVPVFAVIYAMVRRRVDRNLTRRKLTTQTTEYQYLKNIDEQDGTFIQRPSLFPEENEPQEKKGEEESAVYKDDRVKTAPDKHAARNSSNQDIPDQTSFQESGPKKEEKDGAE